MTSEGEILWEPSQEMKESSNIIDYARWLESEERLSFKNYQELQTWSVSHVSEFWKSIYEYFEVGPQEYDFVVDDENKVFGADWFHGAKVNYAQQIFRNHDPCKTAIIFRNEKAEKRSLSWAELQRQTSALSSALCAFGVKPGDRVAAFIPNIPEAIVGVLACASIGAIWSSCSTDFGVPSVVDRFSQIKPRVLLGVNGVSYNGKYYNKFETLRGLQASLPSLEKTILIEYGHESRGKLENSVIWSDLLSSATGNLAFESVPFSSPLWILYSSGTTGLPKPLVHSHGGILLEHLKVLSLHQNVKPEDLLFWYTTTGWMMWNYILSGLLLDCTLVLYDGNPMYPEKDSLWRVADETKISIFGTSAAYINACKKASISPRFDLDLSSLKSVSSTGSPLSVDAFEYLYQNLKGDLWVASVSGGTDLCTAFVGGCPLLPVTAGEIQCQCLGADVRSFDEQGRAVTGAMGELVISKPLPSMPIYLWGDRENQRYLESYFSTFPGVWRHGDWIKITERGTCQIYGRSDSTIKRMGLRMGTSEIYRAVESLPEIHDSLAVDVDGLQDQLLLILFVVLPGETKLDASLEEKIRKKIATDLSPRFVPDRIIAVPEIPRTLNGKKMEVPVKRILMGVPIEKALSLDSMSNPNSIAVFEQIRI